MSGVALKGIIRSVSRMRAARLRRRTRTVLWLDVSSTLTASRPRPEPRRYAAAREAAACAAPAPRRPAGRARAPTRRRPAGGNVRRCGCFLPWVRPGSLRTGELLTTLLARLADQGQLATPIGSCPAPLPQRRLAEQQQHRGVVGLPAIQRRQAIGAHLRVLGYYLRDRPDAGPGAVAIDAVVLEVG